MGGAIQDRRDQVVVATKFGAVSHTGQLGLDSTPANTRLAVEGSLLRHGTHYIDLYYQRRVDPNTSIEDSIGLLTELIAVGEVRHIGLSEASSATIRRAHAVHLISAIQTEYSPWTRDPESDVLPTTRELGIGFVPYAFLVDQLSRAALSISANIAEGKGRFTKADWKKFFIIARGSIQECVPLLELARRRALIGDTQHAELKSQLEEISKMLSGLINDLENRKV